MKLFLKKTLTNLLLIFLILAGILAYSLNEYYKYRVPKIKKTCFTNQIKKHKDVNLILGCSYNFFGLKAEILGDNFVNMACIMQSYMEDYEILKYCTNHAKINSVILNVSFYSNHHYLYKHKFTGERLRVIDYQLSYNPNYTRILPITDIVTLAPLAFKFITREDDAHNFSNQGDLEIKCKNKKYKLDDLEQTLSNHFADSNFSHLNPYLDSIVNWCNKNKIKLNLVNLPFTNKYNENIDKTSYPNYITTLKNRYLSNSVKIFDYRKFLTQADQSQMFKDVDHLSACGRELLSNELKQEVYKSN